MKHRSNNQFENISSQNFFPSWQFRCFFSRSLFCSITRWNENWRKNCLFETWFHFEISFWRNLCLLKWRGSFWWQKADTHTHTRRSIELYMSSNTIANEEWKNDTRINWRKSKWTRVRAITREWEGANEKEMWNKIKWNWIILKIRFSLLPFFQRFYEIMISLSLLCYSLLRRIVGSVVVETTPPMSNGFT